MTCTKFPCFKIGMIQDKDMLPFQYQEAVQAECAGCPDGVVLVHGLEYARAFRGLPEGMLTEGNSKPWEATTLSGHEAAELGGLDAVGVSIMFLEALTNAQAKRTWEWPRGQLPESTPDADWLMVQIGAFFPHWLDQDCEALANHLVRNWLMVELARNVERDRVLVELRDTLLSLAKHGIRYGFFRDDIGRTVKGIIEEVLAHYKELGL